jgi:integrase
VKWGHVAENSARGVDLPTLKTVRPKWVLTTAQAAALLAELPPLARTMAGVALLTGLRRGELFALRREAVNLRERHLTVREAVYEGAFGTPKTDAGLRRVPLLQMSDEPRSTPLDLCRSPSFGWVMSQSMSQLNRTSVKNRGERLADLSRFWASVTLHVLTWCPRRYN